MRLISICIFILAASTVLFLLIKSCLFKDYNLELFTLEKMSYRLSVGFLLYLLMPKRGMQRTVVKCTMWYCLIHSFIMLSIFTSFSHRLNWLHYAYNVACVPVSAAIIIFVYINRERV